MLISTAPIEVKGRNKVLVSAQDITDLRKAVSEIESHRDTLVHQSNLINLSHDAIITLTSDRVITGWNNGAAETYGWKAEEATGQFIHTFLETRNHLPIPEIDAILVRDGGWDGELTHTAKNGETKLVDSRQVVMRDRAGAVSRILEIDRDITSRKKAEQELSRANQYLSELVDELRVTLRERDVLLREVQHRVKNNLQVISSLLALEADRCVHNRVSDALHDSRDRVRSMALIHEKFCHSSSMTEIDFSEYVESLAQSFWSSYGSQMAGVRLHTEVDVHLDMDQAVPSGLIVQELLSNSMKHAFKDGNGGDIRIEFHKQAGEFTLVYRDSGAGLPDEVDLKDPLSLGLQLITDLTYQLGGRMRYQYADGAIFSFTFPSERGRGPG